MRSNIILKTVARVSISQPFVVTIRSQEELRGKEATELDKGEKGSSWEYVHVRVPINRWPPPHDRSTFLRGRR
ncbi:hypothetical protein J6590_041848 [Homalodisca vitripennis]|nr:hypothetical protein J6590_041848 [Homalodisca vitripennis]